MSSKTTGAWRRAPAGYGLLLAGLLAAPCALAHDTPLPIANTEGGSAVVAVSAGYHHSCALKADGAVDCWGANAAGFNQGQAADQPGPYLSVSAGGSHTCGLKPDGAVDCWGDNGHGQATDQPGPYLSVSAGRMHTCALKTNGAVDCWGTIHAQTDFGQAVDQPGPYLSVSAGMYHSCGLKADGAADCWGLVGGGSDINVGQAGDRPGPYLSVSVGEYHSCGLKADGALDCWGLFDIGPGQAAGPYVSVSSGALHACGLKVDGSVVCWGHSGDGRLGTDEQREGPYLLVSAGRSHTCALKADGSQACWGAGAPGTSGNPNMGQSTIPESLALAGNTAFGQIAAGNAHVCDLQRDGTIACWGADDEGQATPPAGLFTQMVTGDSHSCAIGTDSKITCWGRNGAANTMSLATGTWRQSAPGPDGAVCGLSATTESDRCVREAAVPFTYGGYGFRNITHDRNNANANRPNLCGVLAGGGVCTTGFDAAHVTNFAGPWQRLESGLNHQCGLKANGNIECWGDNADGQMAGMSTLENDATPLENDATPLYGLAGPFRTFSVGWNHGCAIRGNGTLACWGSNLNGQATPPAGAYVQVAAGNVFSCAIRSDGERVCWGAVPGTLDPSSLPDATAGLAYPATQLSVSSMAALPGTVLYAHLGGTLPNGLMLSESGLLAGTPTRAGTFNFTLGAEGDDGLTASRSYTVVIIDITPPAIAYTLNGAAGPFPDPTAWYTGDVAIAWTTTDPESDITASSGCTPSAITSDTLGATASCSATSSGGTSSLTTSSIRRDATAPHITAAATTAANANGWYSGNVTIHYTCSDETSGVASCPADQLLAASGSSNAQTIFDNAGNSATSNVVTVQIDKSAPNVGYGISPVAPDGNNDWYRGNVGIDWTISDAQSGIAGSNGCDGATLATDSAGASWTCTATNGAGLQASDTTATIKRDGTAPTITAAATTAANANGWYGGNVTIHFECSDATSGLAAACPADVVMAVSGSSPAVTIFDNAGNSATSNVVTVQIDKSAPNVGYGISPVAPDGNNDWYRGNVGIDWTISDAQSGIAGSNGCDGATLATDSAGASWTCTATNGAGLQARLTSSTVKRDATPPRITAAATTAANANGWYGGNVTIHFECSDATSGLAAACPADVVMAVSGSSPAVTIFDNAGNSATSNVVTVQIDKSAPTVVAAAAAPDGNNGWYRGNVAVAFTCSDALSGVATCPAAQTLSAEGSAVASSAGTATDNAGNVSAPSNVVTVKIDKTGPTLAPTVPSPLLRGQSYSATPNAADATSGMASQSCGALDTSALGSKSTSCTATDNAGNSRTVGLNYTVTTTCVNDGYKSTQLSWCQNICENGLTGAALDNWIHRWIGKYRDLPYCRIAAPPAPL